MYVVTKENSAKKVNKFSLNMEKERKGTTAEHFISLKFLSVPTFYYVLCCYYKQIFLCIRKMRKKILNKKDKEGVIKNISFFLFSHGSVFVCIFLLYFYKCGQMGACSTRNLWLSRILVIHF